METQLVVLFVLALVFGLAMMFANMRAADAVATPITFVAMLAGFALAAAVLVRITVEAW